MYAGKTFNSVPDKATIITRNYGNLLDTLINENVKHSHKNGEITVFGKSAHAATPQKGENAALKLVRHLDHTIIESSLLKFIQKNFIDDVERILPCFEDESGAMSINLGKVEINRDKEEAFIDIRMPVKYSKDALVSNLVLRAKEFDLECTLYDYLEGFIMPENHVLIQTLMNSYESVTKTRPPVLTTGGATYARAMQNCVAFGAIFQDKPKVEHQANEYIDLDDWFLATEIYTQAIYDLVK